MSLLLPFAGAGVGTPIPPTQPPFQGDPYIYDIDGPLGTVTGGTVQPNPNQDSVTGSVVGGTVQAGPNQGSATGSVTGGTIQPGPNQGSATGSISGGTVLPSDTNYD